MRIDSINRVDSLSKNNAVLEKIKHSEEDSVLALKEFTAQSEKYDSLRELDSLKTKRKRHPSIKPAPKRELWAKSPVK